MSTVKVQLNKVEVEEGQGVTEGDFELRIQASQGSSTIVWPSASGWQKVDKGGAACLIGETIATYSLTGTTTKTFDIAVTEVDGTSGDDTGTGSVSFSLSPTMSDTYKSDTISLKRPDGGWKGKVKVTLKAYR